MRRGPRIHPWVNYALSAQSPKTTNGRSLEEELDEEELDEEASLIEGRTQWFGEHAGTHADSTSSVRFLELINQAITMGDCPRRALATDLVREAFYEALKNGRRGAILQDSRLEIHPVAEDNSVQGSAFGAFGPILSVQEVPPPYGMLVLRIEPEHMGGAFDLDLETAVFSHWGKDSQERVLIEASKFHAGDNLLIGRITMPGLYQAIALPRHPLMEPVLGILAKGLTWLRAGNQAPGAELYDEDTKSLSEVLTALGDSKSIPDLSALISFIIEKFLKSEPETAKLIAEPPVLKLWRLTQLGEPSWTSLGPFAGEKVTWPGRITQIDTHPTDGNIVIAAAAGGGVWRTNNSGLLWYPLMEKEPTLTMGAVAFAPSDPNIIYAASGEDAGRWNPSWPGAGVYRSENGGANWTLTAKVASTRFSAIVVDPRRPGTIYVAGNKGLHKSTNGGRSWIANPGLLSLFDGRITDVVLDYDDTERVYIGAHNLGILRSETGGQSQNGGPAFRLLDQSPLPTGCDAGWIKLTIGRKGKNRSRFLATKLGQGGHLTFRTTDGGDTWQELAPVNKVSYHEWTSVIAVDPSDESRIYLGTTFPVIAFWDEANHKWQVLPQETFDDQQDIAFDNQDSKHIFLANDGGVFVSIDRGENWVPASGDLRISQIYDLDISEQDSEVVVCGAQDTGFFRRDSSGMWKQHRSGDVTQVAIDPADIRLLFFVKPTQETFLAIHFLIDGGDTFDTRPPVTSEDKWPRVPIFKLHPAHDIADPCKHREMFLCAKNTIFHSSNAGQKFVPVADNPGCPFRTDGEITALEYAPSQPSILYLGTSTGALYKTTKGGKSPKDWSLLKSLSKTSVSAICVDRQNPDHVWVVMAGNGVSRLARPDENQVNCDSAFALKTTNGGEEWINAGGVVPGMRLPNAPISGVAIDSFDPNLVYVGTDVGVFRTSDGGISWLAFQDGLPRSPVTELRLHHGTRTLFVATMGRGVFRKKLE